VATRWACPSCGESPARGARLVCPGCGSPVRLACGDEIDLVRIELEVP
jgi:Zn finger protein HypA/HybF involved in hydrogenase expression